MQHQFILDFSGLARDLTQRLVKRTFPILISQLAKTSRIFQVSAYMCGWPREPKACQPDYN